MKSHTLGLMRMGLSGGVEESNRTSIMECSKSI